MSTIIIATLIGIGVSVSTGIILCIVKQIYISFNESNE